MMDVLSSLAESKNLHVVVDYRTTNNNMAYAKGILVSVDAEKQKICVKGPSRFWIVDVAAILVCRITNGEKQAGEPESYLKRVRK